MLYKSHSGCNLKNGYQNNSLSTNKENLAYLSFKFLHLFRALCCDLSRCMNAFVYQWIRCDGGCLARVMRYRYLMVNTPLERVRLK